MSYDMIHDSAVSLFSNEVTKELIEQTETGTFPSELWDILEESGFTRIMCKEADGGMQDSWEAAFPILHSAGYYQVPAPLAETIITSFILSLAEQTIPEGPLSFVAENKLQHLNFQQDADKTMRLSGSLKNVPWARWCKHLLVPHPEANQMYLINLQDPSIQIEPGLDKAKMPSDSITLNQTSATATFAWEYQQHKETLLHLGALAQSIMIAGALDFALELAVTYVKDRVQFGKPIGKNQAIQQQLALIAGHISSTKMAALIAAQDAIDTNNPDSEAFILTTAIAKTRSSEAVSVCTGILHQVHGAIGFTYEYPLNFATRRLWTWREQYGTDTFWAQRLGKAAIAAGKDEFWSKLTAKQLMA